MPRILQKLVAGSFQLTGGTPASGKVLTSDSVGNASWETPTGGGTPAPGSIGVLQLNDDEIALYVKLNAEVFG